MNMRLLRQLAIGALFGMIAMATVGLDAQAAKTIDNGALLREVWQAVNERFFDPKFGGVDWAKMLEKHQPRAQQATDREELARVINAMLAELHTSHMGFYTGDDREYYELIDIFNQGKFAEEVKRRFRGGVVRYEGVGIVTKAIDGNVFISDVLDDSPAQKGGLKVGDEIISADREPFHPIKSFRGKAGDQVEMTVRRNKGGDPIQVRVEPQWIQPHGAFLNSVKSSARIIERDGKRIGYVRIRSYASQDYQDALVEIVTGDGKLAGADALVLDIRGGWGGANPEYLELFNDQVPRLESINRDGEKSVFDPRWRKPVVLLVDEGTRSGKEVLTHGFKKFSIGKVVGMRTAGAVVGGSPMIVGDGGLLLVAVADVLVDGERIEGKGVEPDVTVDFDLPYANGEDPQLERAVDEAAREV